VTQTKSPIPYFGGKITLAPQIAAALPAHEHYVEPYAGSLAVLLAKPRTPFETVNDLDQQLITFWRVCRDRPIDLARVCALTPHSRAEHQAAYEPASDDLEVARRVWVQLSQGRAGVRQRTGWRHYQQPRGVASVPVYLRGYVERIAPAADRLAGVSLECMPALDLIARYGRSHDVLLYVDPPYLGEARAADDSTSRARTKRYLHEMYSDDEHRQLAAALTICHAAVVLSGYPSPLYDELYGDWYRHEMAASTGQGGGTWANRTEVLWSNRPIGEPHLFSEVTG
jgi:DNA adenine methylase